MRKESVNAAFFFLVLVVLAALGFLVLLPILDFLLLGLLFALGFWPVHQWIHRAVPYPRLAALTTLSFVAVVAVAPLVIVVVSLMGDIRGLLEHMDPDSLQALVLDRIGSDGLLGMAAVAVAPHVSGFFSSVFSDLASIIARMVIGLVVMGFVMYFSFADGPRMVEQLRDLMPLKEVYKRRLLNETRSVVEAIFFGQLLVGIAHGFVLGLAFFIFGIPNPFVWAVVVVIVSLLPAIGTPAVYLPMAVYLYIVAGPVVAIVFALYGVVFSTGLVEYWLRLRLMDRMAKVHPLVVVLGVIGGVAAFGLSGFIFGPLILSLLIVFTRVFSNTYKEDENYLFL